MPESTEQAPHDTEGLKGFFSDRAVRLRVVREYAASVLGSDELAARWLDRSHMRICGGMCTVTEACASAVGFYEAMAELAKLNQFEQRESRKRAYMARQGLEDEASPPHAKP